MHSKDEDQGEHVFGGILAYSGVGYDSIFYPVKLVSQSTAKETPSAGLGAASNRWQLLQDRLGLLVPLSSL